MRCPEIILEVKLKSFEATRWCVKNGNKRGKTWEKRRRKINAACQVKWWWTILGNAHFFGWLFCIRERERTLENWPKKKEKRRKKNIEREERRQKERRGGRLHFVGTYTCWPQKYPRVMSGVFFFQWFFLSKTKLSFICFT